MFFKELWDLNPVKFILGTSEVIPEWNSNARIIVYLETVGNKLLQQIQESRPYIRSLRLRTKDNHLILKGEVDPSDYWIFRRCNIRSIHYYVCLKLVSIQENIVRFKIISYSLNNPKMGKWDIVRFLARIDPIHKRKLLKAIVDSNPNILKLTPIVGEILFNLNYFLSKVPSLGGKIEVGNADLINDTVIFHTSTFVILKPLMDLLGPEYIKVTYSKKGKYF